MKGSPGQKLESGDGLVLAPTMTLEGRANESRRAPLAETVRGPGPGRDLNVMK